MTETPTQAYGQLLRISVVAGDRTVDVAAPRSVPIIELIPGLARTMGLLEAGTAYGGYTLTRADGGIRLDAGMSLQAQGVAAGDVLTLIGGANEEADPVYDDIVEAVADAVESEHRPWSPQDSALTSLLGAAALLLTAAVLLFGNGGAAMAPAIISGTAAALLLVSAVVIGIAGRLPAAPVVLVHASAVFGFVAGYRAIPRASGAEVWAMPLLVGGSGVMLIGVVGLLAIRSRSQFAVTPVVTGAGLSVVGFLVSTFDLPPAHAFAAIVAVVGLAGLALPWLALATTPLRVVSPRDDEEIYADVPPVERAEVAEAYAHGHRLHIGLRIGAGLLMLVAIPTVVGVGIVGALLLVIALAGMLLSVRDSYSRVDVAVVSTIAITGFAATGITAALVHPSWQNALTVTVAAFSVVVMAFTLVTPKPRLWLGRLADTAELICMGGLVPLVVVLTRWGG